MIAVSPVVWPNSGWDRAAIEKDAAAYYQLTLEDINDLRRALAHLRQKHGHGKIDLFKLSPDDFPLSTFQNVLENCRKALQFGRGWQTLRGFPVAEHSIKDLELIFFAIGMHLGVARPQGKASLFLANVRDIGTDYRGTSGRGYTSKAALDFHSDGSDVVGLFCLKTAIEGGESLISSSIRVHNEMLKLRPDLVEELYKPMIFGRQGEEAPEETPYYECPIMGRARDGTWSCRFIRNVGSLIDFSTMINTRPLVSAHPSRPTLLPLHPAPNSQTNRSNGPIRLPPHPRGSMLPHLVPTRGHAVHQQPHLPA